MLDARFVRENLDAVKAGLAHKQVRVDLDRFAALDARRRAVILESEALKQEKNTISEQMARLRRAGSNDPALIDRSRTLGADIKRYDAEMAEVEAAVEALLLEMPNLPDPSVPVGADAAANVEYRRWGDQPAFDFTPRDHLALGEALDLLDMKRGAKIAGTGFPVYRNVGATLERALINFMLDLHTRRHGYTEVFPPFLVNADSARGTGQLPKLAEDMYRTEEDGLYLIPTAEVPVTNLLRDEILPYESLPVRYTAYSACFRREAGSYGRDTRGLLRVHQFNKVEMVKFVDPETSPAELENLLRDAEEVLQLLELPYRVMTLCTGDLSFAAAKCYDIEVWAAGEQKYLEVSSCSNFGDFQARRMNIRFRREGKGKPQYVHTLNGSGVATARLMVALLEHYQTDEGTVMVPAALRDYMGVEVIQPV